MRAGSKRENFKNDPRVFGLSHRKDGVAITSDGPVMGHADGRGDQACSLGHIKFEMPILHLNRDGREAFQ